MPYKMILGTFGLTGAVALLMASAPINPAPWSSPTDHFPANACETAQVIRAKNLTSDLPAQPDGLAFSPEGHLLAALANGEVWSIDPSDGATSLAFQGEGFLTGLAAAEDGSVYAVDERDGRLLRAGPGETLQTVLEKAGENDLSWTNDVTLLEDGTVALTTTATGRGLDAFFEEVLEHRPSGLLIHYRPDTSDARVVRNDLAMANGIAASGDGRSVIVAQSAIYGVSKIVPDGTILSEIRGLPGFTGNIRASDRPGVYWLTLLSPRSILVDALDQTPWVRRLLVWLPSALRPGPQPWPCLVEVQENGDNLSARVVRVVGSLPSAYSTAIERNGRLYLSPAGIIEEASMQVQVADLADMD